MSTASPTEPLLPEPASQPRPAVAYLLDYCPRSWGTRDDMLLALARSWVERQVLPILVFSEEVSGDVRRRYEDAGASVRSANYRRGVFHYWFALRALVAEHRVGLAHVRFFHLYTLVPWLARLAGIPRIVYTDAEGGVLSRGVLKRCLLRLRVRLLTAPVDRLIAISEFVRQRLLGLGVHAERLTVIYNGADSSRFRPLPQRRGDLGQRFGIQPGELIALTVSALLPIKNPHLLIEAAAELARRGAPIRILVAGDGPLRRELEDLALQRGVAAAIHWLGYVADPTELFQGCDVFVLASVGEAFGNVLTEAMACGIPVVASRSGGISEVVEHGHTGLLVPPLDGQALADALQAMARDASLRAAMGQHGRARVLERFTLARFVEQTAAVYESLWQV